MEQYTAYEVSKQLIRETWASARFVRRETGLVPGKQSRISALETENQTSQRQWPSSLMSASWNIFQRKMKIKNWGFQNFKVGTYGQKRIKDLYYMFRGKEESNSWLVLRLWIGQPWNGISTKLTENVNVW